MGYIDYNILIYKYICKYIYCIYIYVNIIYIYIYICKYYMYMYVIILYYICYIIYIILVKYVHRLQVQCGGLQQPHRRLRSRLWLAGGRWGARRNGGRVGSDLNFWCHVVHLGRNTEDRPKKDKNGPKICQFWSILMIPNQRPQDKPTIFPGFSFQFPLFFSSAGAAGDDSHQCSSRSDHVGFPCGMWGAYWQSCCYVCLQGFHPSKIYHEKSGQMYCSKLGRCTAVKPVNPNTSTMAHNSEKIGAFYGGFTCHASKKRGKTWGGDHSTCRVGPLDSGDVS